MDYLIALLDWIPAYLVLVKLLQKSVIIYRYFLLCRSNACKYWNILYDSKVVPLLLGLVSFLLILCLISASLGFQSAESQRETASQTIDLIKVPYMFGASMLSISMG